MNREHPTGTERKSLTYECGWKGGDRGGLAEREKMEEIIERAEKTIDRDRPSHGGTLAITSGLPTIRTGAAYSGISNEVGRCQEVSSSFFASWNLFLFSIEHTHALAQVRPFFRELFPPSIAVPCPPYALSPVTSSFWCCPPNISSILTDHDELSELPGYPGMAGRLINRTVTIRTISDFKHPRTGCTTLLLLSAMTELFIINLVPQHDPQSDSQLACYRHASFPQTFLCQFASIETFQLGVTAYCVSTGFTPQEPQQRTALFRYFTEPLGSSTGALPRDDQIQTAAEG